MPRSAPADAELVERIRAVLSCGVAAATAAPSGSAPPRSPAAARSDVVAAPAGQPSGPRRDGGADGSGWVPRAPDARAGPVEVTHQPRPQHRAHRARADVGPGGDPAGRSGPRGAAAPGVPRVLQLPEFLRLARVRVPGRAVVGLVVVAIVAAVVLTLRVAAASRAAEPVSVASALRSGPSGRSVPAGFTGLARPSPTEEVPTTAPQAGASTDGAGPPVVVHVVGHVLHPGVVRLPAGSRVLDAVDRAGGALPDADLRRINLARFIGDGEQVFVPSPTDPVDVSGLGGSASIASGSAGSTGAAARTRVNLNSADLGALDSLPGVGPVLAQRILDWRTAHGRFTSVDELGEVSGIGAKLLAEIAPRVTL